MSVEARTGRHRQRYDKDNARLVAGYSLSPFFSQPRAAVIRIDSHSLFLVVYVFIFFSNLSSGFLCYFFLEFVFLACVWDCANIF